MNYFNFFFFVGVIQAIHPDEHPDYNRICKEIVVFQAKHLEILEALLHIDTTAAPKQQVWRFIARLNYTDGKFIKWWFYPLIIFSWTNKKVLAPFPPPSKSLSKVYLLENCFIFFSSSLSIVTRFTYYFRRSLIPL